MCSAHPLFGHVIAGSYKKGAAHPSESDMSVCDLCNQSFSTQGSLKRHQESVHHHLAGFSCQVCSQRFYRKDHLGRHPKVYRPPVEVRRDLLGCSMDATVACRRRRRFSTADSTASSKSMSSSSIKHQRVFMTQVWYGESILGTLSKSFVAFLSIQVIGHWKRHSQHTWLS